MHIPGGVLDPATLIATGVAATGAVVAAGAWVGRGSVSGPGGGTMRGSPAPTRLAVAVAAGAGVLAAHLAEVPLVAGQTAHLLGAALLAIALGPRVAVLVMTGALLVEALVFDFGGILALGANVMVMGVLAVMVAAWVDRMVLEWARDRADGHDPSVGWHASAAALATVASVIAASVAVVGVLALGAPASLDGAALGALIPAHLAWAGAEAAITAGCVALAVAWNRSRTRAAVRADFHRHVHVLDGEMDRLG